MAIEDDNTTSTQADMELLDGEETIVETPVRVPAKSPKLEQPPPDEKPDDQSVVDGEESVEEEVETEEAPPDEEILPHQRPTVSAIKEKFPELFKEFPTLKASLFREKAYAEVFPTVADAQQASENNDTFVNMRDDILNGGGNKLVDALKDDGSLDKFAGRFLTNLFKADKEVHWRTISPILQDAARAFYDTGIRSKDDNIKHAAEHLAIFLFGDPDFASGKKTIVTAAAPKTDGKEEETDVSKERKEWETQKLNDFTGEVKSDAYTNLRSLATIGLPKDGITKWQRDKLIDDIVTKVDQAITADKAHMKFMQGLWKKAREARFDTGSKTRITNAYLARAKTLVPGIRRTLMTEALGTISPRATEVTEEVTSRSRTTSSGRPTSPNGRSAGPKAIDWSKTSDADFLNDNITLKK